MRGIEFKYNNGYGSILHDLFKCLSLEEYDIYIYEDEIIKNESNMQLTEKMSGIDFETKFAKPSYLVYFANIQVYKKGAKPSILKAYEDFLNSACEFILLISDAWCVEIYAKDKNKIIQFIENAEQCGCEEIVIKTDKEDGRTSLSVI